MAANQGKGWFAIMLGKQVDHKTILPDYINNAIFFARPELSKELFSNIFGHRLSLARGAGTLTQAALEAAQIELRQYLAGTTSLADLKTFMNAMLPGDQIHRHLANVH